MVFVDFYIYSDGFILVSWYEVCMYEGCFKNNMWYLDVLIYINFINFWFFLFVYVFKVFIFDFLDD